MHRAAPGDLIRRHGTDDDEEKKLIVVYSFEEPAPAKKLEHGLLRSCMSTALVRSRHATWASL
jgi:hypothetical protein